MHDEENDLIFFVSNIKFLYCNSNVRPAGLSFSMFTLHFSEKYIEFNAPLTLSFDKSSTFILYIINFIYISKNESMKMYVLGRSFDFEASMANNRFRVFFGVTKIVYFYSFHVVFYIFAADRLSLVCTCRTSVLFLVKPCVRIIFLGISVMGIIKGLSHVVLRRKNLLFQENLQRFVYSINFNFNRNKYNVT